MAVMLPALIALLAIYIRATCPESPYWVRAQDRKRRIAETLSAGHSVAEDDRAWYAKAGRVGIRQVFMPDVLPATMGCPFRRLLQLLHFRHGGHLDALLLVNRKALVDARV